MLSSSNPLEIVCVVFDVGGVLVELTGAARLLEWTEPKYRTESELYEAWICSPAVQHFECGHCSAKDFSAAIVREFELPVSDEVFIDEFEKWPNGLFKGAKPLLERVKGVIPIACLSNTNDVHWPNQKDAEYLNDIFDHMFLSYQMGMVKPDQRIFTSMIDALDVPPHQILFLDDNQICVDAGKRAGLTSHLAKGIDQVGRILESMVFQKA